MFTIFNIQKDNANLMQFKTWFDTMKAFFSSTTPVTKQTIIYKKKSSKTTTLARKKVELVEKLKKLKAPTRTLSSIIGQ